MCRHLMWQQVLAPKQNTKPVDSRDDTNLWYFTIMAEYINLMIKLSIRCEVTLSHFITLHNEHYNSFGHDPAPTLFYKASIIQ